MIGEKRKNTEKDKALSCDSLDLKLISHIQSFLPNYQFRSKNAVGNVSKRWHKAQSEHAAKTVGKSKEAMLASCHTKHDAMFFLQDGRFFKRFSIDEQLQIIAACPILAKTVIANAGDLLNSGQIALLGKDESVARMILVNPTFIDRLDPTAMGILGSKNLSVAKFMLRETRLRQKLNPQALRMLGMKFEDIAITILNSPELLKILGLDLLTFGAHLSTATQILDTPHLNENIDLGRLGVHEALAWRILNTAVFRERLKANDLYHLARHPLVAERILDEPNLQAKLDSSALGAIGAHQVLATRILNTSYLRAKLDAMDLYFMGAANEDVAKRILEEKDLRDKLEGAHLGLLGSIHQSVAVRILNEVDLQVKLEAQDLSMLGLNHQAIAMHILNNPVLRNKLGSTRIFTFCSHQPVAIKILQEPDLQSNLTSFLLLDIGRKWGDLIPLILKNNLLKQKLTAADHQELLRTLKLHFIIKMEVMHLLKNTESLSLVKP